MAVYLFKFRGNGQMMIPTGIVHDQMMMRMRIDTSGACE